MIIEIGVSIDDEGVAYSGVDSPKIWLLDKKASLSLFSKKKFHFGDFRMTKLVSELAEGVSTYYVGLWFVSGNLFFIPDLTEEDLLKNREFSLKRMIENSKSHTKELAQERIQVSKKLREVVVKSRKLKEGSK